MKTKLLTILSILTVFSVFVGQTKADVAYDPYFGSSFYGTGISFGTIGVFAIALCCCLSALALGVITLILARRNKPKK